MSRTKIDNTTRRLEAAAGRRERAVHAATRLEDALRALGLTASWIKPTTNGTVVVTLTTYETYRLAETVAQAE